MRKVGIDSVSIPSARIPIVGWEREGAKVPHPGPGYDYPAYELSCEQSEFVKNTAYTVRVMQTQAASEQMQVNVTCVGGTVTPSSFGTDSPQNLKVTPSEDTCIVTLVCDGREVGRFEMREVLTVPEYIFGSSETKFEIGTEYELTVARVTAPIKQTQIDVSCTGGLVSPQFLVDEGTPFAFDGPNSKVLVTPTDERCVVTLKVNLAGMVYSVGKFTMKAEEPAPEYLVSTITIDQNISDPDTMITGDVNGEAIQAIRNNSHIYLCKYLGEKDGEGQMAICQLDDNDETKYFDGQDANTIGGEGDVFWHHPTFYTKAVQTKEDVWDISFRYGGGDMDGWKKWSGDELIGRSKSHEYIDKANSINTSNVKGFYKKYPKRDDAISSASERGIGYMITQYHMRCLTNFLYLAIYGNTDSQKVIPDNYFLGMYGLFISGAEWIDNIYVNNEDNNFIVYENGRDRIIDTPIDYSSSGFISKLVIGENLDIIPKEIEGTSTTGYCDNYYSNKNYRYMLTGSASAQGGSASNSSGMFYILMSMNDSAQSNRYARLAFTGNLIEYTDVEAFKALPIIN